MAALGELDGLRDRGVRRNAAHVHELVDAEAQQVDEVGIERDETAANALGEDRIDPRAPAQHSVHELARPAAVARIERTSMRRSNDVIEHLAGPKVARRCSAAATARDSDAADRRLRRLDGVGVNGRVEHAGDRRRGHCDFAARHPAGEIRKSSRLDCLPHRRRHPHRISRRGDSRVHQNSIDALFHHDACIRRRADAGIDDHRNA